MARSAEKEADGEAFERLAVFVRNLAENYAFGNKFEKSRRTVGGKLESYGGRRPPAESVSR